MMETTLGRCHSTNMLSVALILFSALLSLVACATPTVVAQEIPKYMDASAGWKNDAVEVKTAQIGITKKDLVVNLVESPDHKQIAVVAATAPITDTNRQYFVVWAKPGKDLTGQTYISVTTPVFSPNSTAFAFAGKRDNAWRVVLVNDMVAREFEAYSQDAPPGSIIFNSDGTWLAYPITYNGTSILGIGGAIGRGDWEKGYSYSNGADSYGQGNYEAIMGITFVPGQPWVAYILKLRGLEQYQAVIPAGNQTSKHSPRDFQYDEIVENRIVFSADGQHWAFIGHDKAENTKPDHYYLITDTHVQKRYDWAAHLSLAPGTNATFNFLASQDGEIHRVSETITP